jgi:hypothetical protein
MNVSRKEINNLKKKSKEERNILVIQDLVYRVMGQQVLHQHQVQNQTQDQTSSGSFELS